MNRPKFHDIDGIGRTPAPSRPGRGLDALIPTAPPADPGVVRRVQWRQLEAALFSLTNAQFEYERGEVEDGRTHVEDCRSALGALALSLADAPDAEGYARLFEAITTEPSTTRRCGVCGRRHPGSGAPGVCDR